MTDPQQQRQHSLDRRTEDPSANLGVFIEDLFNALDKAMAREVAPHGITGLEYSLLWHCLEGERTATQLAQVLPVDGSRISRVVTGLVDRGFLRRRRLRSDRRIVMLRLTEEGMELTSGISENMKSHYAMLTEGIGDEEMRVFASVTSRIVANHAAMEWPE